MSHRSQRIVLGAVVALVVAWVPGSLVASASGDVWGAGASITSAATSTSPAFAHFIDTSTNLDDFAAAWVDSSDVVHITDQRMYNADPWEPVQTVPGVSTAAAPSLGTFGGCFCHVALMWTPTTGGPIEYKVGTLTNVGDPWSWSSLQTVPSATPAAGSAPSAFDGRFLAWRAGNGHIWYAKAASISGTTITWNLPEELPQGLTNATPEVASAYRPTDCSGSMSPAEYILWKGKGNNHQIWYEYTTDGGAGWYPQTTLPHALTRAGPTVLTSMYTNPGDGCYALFVGYLGATGSKIWFESLDSGSGAWSSQQTVNGASTTKGPEFTSDFYGGVVVMWTDSATGDLQMASDEATQQ